MPTHDSLTLLAEPANLEEAPLDALRAQIDAIDDRLLTLLAERATRSIEVGRSKQPSGIAEPVFRPGREAMILRRLLAAAAGNIDRGALVRIWREIFSASIRLQGPFAVAVYAPDALPGYWDLARDHFGSHTPIAAFRSAGQAVRAVTDGQAAVAVLPFPEEDDQDPWWRLLVSGDAAAPRIMARLPFGPRGNAQREGTDALVISRGTPGETGEDRSFLAVEVVDDLSRARLVAHLKAAGLECTFFAPLRRGGQCSNLIEVDGFIGPGDRRLALLAKHLGSASDRILPLGGYALPLDRRVPQGAAPPAS